PQARRTQPPILEDIAMKTRNSSLIALLDTAVLTVSGADAQVSGLSRHDLQRHDLSATGREMIQARIDFAPGAYGPPHTHPGEEIIYVLSGAIDYQIAGQPAVRVSAGEVFFVPAGAVHSARNVGDGPASELATYV